MEKPNILFLSLDSFPADWFFKKNKTSVTPNFDLLMKNSICFTQAISSADGTELSWASIFTSQYTFQTGLNQSFYNKLPSKTLNYIKILKNWNYHPYGHIPSGGEFFGISHDFENKDLVYDADNRLYDGLGEEILQKFNNNELKEPWFYFIHLLDLHLPIFLPKEFNDEKFGDNAYDRMVSAIDAWIGKVLEKIDFKNTLIIITSDHGDFIPSIKYNNKTISYFGTESIHKTLWRIEAKIPSALMPIRNKIFAIGRNLRNKNKSSKFKDLKLAPYQNRALFFSRNDANGYLFDELVRIPLIFSGLNLEHKIINQQVRHVDIFPTINTIIKCPEKIENIQGQNLMPLFKDGKLEEKPVYLECRFRGEEDLSRSAIGIRTSKWKYFRSKDDEKSRVYLFDLENDPLEENNVENNHPKIIEEMEGILKEIRKDVLPENERGKMTDEEAKKVELELRKLGYI